MEPLQLVIPGLEIPGEPDQLVVDRNRQDLLEALYERSGRGDDPTHPHHGCYTGLAEAFYTELGRALVDKLLESVAFHPAMVVGTA